MARIVEKYFIVFDNMEIDLSTKISITKKEYDKQIAFLFSQTELDPDYDGYKVEMIISELIDKGQYTVNHTVFKVGTACTSLYRYIAKDGYTFKSRN